MSGRKQPKYGASLLSRAYVAKQPDGKTESVTVSWADYYALSQEVKTLRADLNEAVVLLRQMTQAFDEHLCGQARDAKVKSATILCPCFETQVTPARAFLSRLDNGLATKGGGL